MRSQRRQGRPLQKVGAAAENANDLITEIRQFGVDISIPTINPLTIRVEVGDREIGDDEKKSAVNLLMALFGKK